MNYPKIYVDFDRTLFNTDELGRMVKMLREKYGIADELWKKYEKEYKAAHNNLFNMHNIMELICKKENFSEDILPELDSTIVNSSNDLIYKDSYPFIRNLKKYGLNITMLTYGDEDFQGKKIDNTNIKKLFDDVIITPINKFEISNLVDYENGIFFDDNPKDVEGLYEQNPFDIIRIRRDNVKYSDIDLKYKDIKECSSLDQVDIEKIIPVKRIDAKCNKRPRLATYRYIY